MATLEDIKKKWVENKSCFAKQPVYDTETFEQIIRIRTKKQKNMIMRYFWGTFTFHLIVYGFLAHVVITRGSDEQVLLAGLAGFVITIPFTVVMMQKFKKMATTKIIAAEANSVYAYAETQRKLLTDFFTFKRRYEWILIPLQCAIGIFIIFRIFMPGGVVAHPVGALVIFGLTLWSCIAAIRMENKKSFIEPLNDLQLLLNEYKDTDPSQK